MSVYTVGTTCTSTHKNECKKTCVRKRKEPYLKSSPRWEEILQSVISYMCTALKVLKMERGSTLLQELHTYKREERDNKLIGQKDEKYLDEVLIHAMLRFLYVFHSENSQTKLIKHHTFLRHSILEDVLKVRGTAFLPVQRIYNSRIMRTKAELINSMAHLPHPCSSKMRQRLSHTNYPYHFL